MTPDIKPFIVGNWKMNGLSSDLSEFETVAAGVDEALGRSVDMALCPPSTLLFRASVMLADSPVKIGGQNCHQADHGAHTGDVSAAMLRDAGASLVIVGHSERRSDHGESNQTVRGKAEAALRATLSVIVCIGESQEQRDDGKTLDILKTQLEHSLPEAMTSQTVIIAYEPIWAIGTGNTASPEDVGEVHGFIRKWLKERDDGGLASIRLLYGGSVKPANAAELMAVDNVDGALVGGASLKATDFLAICEACRN